MQPKLFSIFIAVVILCFVIDLIRRQKMSFKFALSWLASSLAVLILAIYDQWIHILAKWAGFELPSNFIFFLLLVFVIFLSLSMSIYINEQNSRTESLIQMIALLDYKIKKLEQKKSS